MDQQMRNQNLVDQLPYPVVDPRPVRRALAGHRVTGGAKLAGSFPARQQAVDLAIPLDQS